ncbi:MAG: ParB/RepB/Spo0J family partition protein [Bacilli bacterium]
METSRRRALGRGLEELFNTTTLDVNKIEEHIITTAKAEEIMEISLKELRSNPYQPRKNFNELALQELADSIKEHGVFQPIIAKKSIRGYEIIAGERRVKASILAGLDTIPAIIRDFTDEEMMEIALLENLQRENLNALEEAMAYKKLIESLSLTQEQLSLKLGKSRSHITNMIGILNLPEDIKQMIINNEISMGHARVLSKIENKHQVLELGKKIVEQGLNVRRLEELAKDDIYEKKVKNEHHELKNSEYKYVEETMIEKLGTRVKIKNNKIEISFTNVHDLNRILEIIGMDK